MKTNRSRQTEIKLILVTQIMTTESEITEDRENLLTMGSVATYPAHKTLSGR